MARPGLTTHRKFRRLARSLGSAIVARGVLELMWESCYESGDNYLGTAEDIETLVGWNGERGVLAKALVDAGLPEGAGLIDPIQSVHGDGAAGDLACADGVQRYRVHDLWHHAPDYVTKRHKRELERKQRVAPTVKRRKTAPRGGQRPPTPDSQNGLDLPPAPAPAPAPAPNEEGPAPKPHPIRDVIGHYQTCYQAKVGVKPHIDGDKDAALIRALLKQHDAETVRKAIDVFFEDPFAKRAGYSFGLFRSQFNSWLAKVPKSGAGAVRTTMPAATAARIASRQGTA